MRLWQLIKNIWDEWGWVFFGFIGFGFLLLYVAAPILLAVWGYPRLILRFFPAWQSDLGVLLGLLLAPPTYAAMIKVLEWVTARSPSLYAPKNPVVPVSAPPVSPPVVTGPPPQTPYIQPPPPKVLSQAQHFFIGEFEKQGLPKHVLEALCEWVESDSFPLPLYVGEGAPDFEMWGQDVLRAKNYRTWVQEATYSIRDLGDDAFACLKKAFVDADIRKGILAEFITHLESLDVSTWTMRALTDWANKKIPHYYGEISFDLWQQEILSIDDYETWEHVGSFFVGIGEIRFAYLRSAIAVHQNQHEEENPSRASVTITRQSAIHLANEAQADWFDYGWNLVPSLSPRQKEFLARIELLELTPRTENALHRWVNYGLPEAKWNLTFDEWAQNILRNESYELWWQTGRYFIRGFAEKSYTELRQAVVAQAGMDTAEIEWRVRRKRAERIAWSLEPEMSIDFSPQQEEFIVGIGRLKRLSFHTSQKLLKWIVTGFPGTSVTSFEIWRQDTLKADHYFVWPYYFRGFGWKAFVDLQKAIAAQQQGIDD